MQVDIKTTDIRPIRQTFSHVARRLGGDKAASRYQEATLDIQSTTNFHYRPLWQPEYALYDVRRTAIRMADWYVFKDPRHYYYGTYTIARAKQQEGIDRQFEFVEKHGLLSLLDGNLRETLARTLIPLRHYEWGANMNNGYCCAYGYGTAVTQACKFAAMDRLGLAQSLSRIGLLLDANQTEVLDMAKAAWLDDPAWQGLRRVVENLFVTKDWFEVYLAQNLVLDGLVYPLLRRLVADLNPRTGNALAMLTEFNSDWFDETLRWVDATVKTAAEESAANADQLSVWYRTWRDEALHALQPLAAPYADLAALRSDLDARATKLRLVAA